MSGKIFNLMILACVWFACTSATSKPDSNPDRDVSWSDTSNGCRIGVTFSRSCESGAAFDVDVYMQDVSGPKAKLLRDMGKERTWANFSIKRADGSRVKFTEYGSPDPGQSRAEGREFILDAGNQVHEKVRLNTLYDLTDQGEYAMSVSCILYSDTGQISLVIRKLNFRVKSAGFDSAEIEPLMK